MVHHIFLCICNSNKDAKEKLKEMIKEGDCILLKASNRMNFGEISEFLQGR